MTPDEIQLVYDEAFERGILEAPLVYAPEDHVSAARIEEGNLVETIYGEDWPWKIPE